MTSWGPTTRSVTLRRLGATAALGLAGCPTTVEVQDFPPEVAYVAMIELAGREVADSSALVRVDDAVTFFGDDDRDLALVGFAKEPIASWVDRWFEGAIPAARLAPAEACSRTGPPPLPAAVWFATANADGSFSTRDAAEAPALGAPWLVDRCPDFDADQVSVDVVCDINHCVETRTKTGPCRFEIDLGHCGQPPLVMSVRPDRSVCVEATDQRTCVASVPEVEATASLLCGGTLSDTGLPFDACRTEIHLTDAPILSVVARRTLTRQASNLPGWTRGGPPIQELDDLRRGPLTDLVARGDRVAVLGLPEAPLPSPNAACTDAALRPITLYLLEPRSLEPVGRRELPPCAVHLVDDPAGDGFAYAFPDRTADRWTVQRVDIDGRPAGEVPLAITATGAEVIDLQRSRTGPPRLFALVVFSDPDDAESADLFEIDPVALRVVASRSVDGRFFSLGIMPTGELLMGSSRQNNLELLRGPFEVLGQQRVPFEFDTIARKDLRLIDLAWAGTARDAAIAVSGNRPSVVAWPSTSPQAAGPLDVNFQPGPVVTWPDRPGRVLVGGVTIGRPTRGLVQAFDVATARFVPGVAYIGASGVTALSAHPNGEVYALLGWTSEVVRLRPTP